MGEQRLYQARGDWLKLAVDRLRAAGTRVVAPVADEQGAVELAAVVSADEIVLDYANVRLPLKALFLPATEVLLEFETGRGGDVDVQPGPIPAEDVVVMGCRPCDAAALDVLDKVFISDYDDIRYRARRERTTVVTFACSRPGPECFCTSVGGSPHGAAASDVLVFLDDDEGETLMQARTEKGNTFIERLGDALDAAADGAAPTAPPDLQPKFDTEKIKGWLDGNFDNDDFWAEAALACLGCGACSYLCPTCHCFDIVDEASWNRGQRRRNWDCCSFALFTLHASGHNPRPDQASRWRQRIMHKFKYFPERFGRLACVGCGRCTRTCGVGRNMVTLLSGIESR